MNEIVIEEWVVVHAGMRSYLGKVDDVTETAVLAQTHGMVLAEAFDLSIMARDAGKGRIERVPLVMPLDVTTTGSLPLWVYPSAVYKCADMHDSDKARYRDLVIQARKTCQQAMAGAPRIVLG